MGEYPPRITLYCLVNFEKYKGGKIEKYNGEKHEIYPTSI